MVLEPSYSWGSLSVLQLRFSSLAPLFKYMNICSLNLFRACKKSLSAPLRLQEQTGALPEDSAEDSVSSVWSLWSGQSHGQNTAALRPTLVQEPLELCARGVDRP